MEFSLNSIYVPWESSYLNGMGTELTRSIGVGANIGITLFGFIFGIYLLVMIVRYFTGKFK